jgi:hypothetical protein
VVAEKLALNHVDVLLELVPEHNCVNCSDERPNRDEGRCTRCTLLGIKEAGFSDWRITGIALRNRHGMVST